LLPGNKTENRNSEYNGAHVTRVHYVQEAVMKFKRLLPLLVIALVLLLAGLYMAQVAHASPSAGDGVDNSGLQVNEVPAAQVKCVATRPVVNRIYWEVTLHYKGGYFIDPAEGDTGFTIRPTLGWREEKPHTYIMVLFDSTQYPIYYFGREVQVKWVEGDTSVKLKGKAGRLIDIYVNGHFADYCRLGRPLDH
jgi:hypothetical protein